MMMMMMMMMMLMMMGLLIFSLTTQNANVCNLPTYLSPFLYQGQHNTGKQENGFT